MERIFLRVAEMSFSAAIVIAVTLLLRLVLRRAPKKWSYLLWSATAFRLCCPVSFRSAFSIFRLGLHGERGEAAALRTVVRVPGPIVDPGPIHTTQGTALPIPAGAISAASSVPDPAQRWLQICAILWLAGLAAMLLLGAVRYVRMRARLSDAAKLEKGAYVSDKITVPFILGLTRPRIYLPVGLEGKPLAFVLAHERTHLRRGDHWAKLLAYLLLALHWFNPLVWLAFFLMSRDMEMSCDERVLAAYGSEARDYSRTLLSFALGRRFPAPAPLAFGESDVSCRIRNALRWKKPQRWVTVAALLLCLAAIAACASDPKEQGTPAGEEDMPDTPWAWSSRLKSADVREAAFQNGTTREERRLTLEQVEEVVALLNAATQEQVVPGRGIPSQRLLELRDTGYALRFAGGIIELDLPDGSEWASQGVWEIHSEELSAWLEKGWEDSGLDATSLPNQLEDPEITAEEVLAHMAALKAEEALPSSPGTGVPDGETLAEALHAAAAHPWTGELPEDAQRLYWTLNIGYNEPNAVNWTALTNHFQLLAGLAEDLVKVSWYWGDDPRPGVVWVEDPALYQLVRDCYRQEPVIEADAWAQFGALLESHAQHTVDTYAPTGAGGFTGYTITRLEKTAHVFAIPSEAGGETELAPVYVWEVAYTPEDVRRIGFSGAMSLDGDERVTGFEPGAFFTVRTVDGEPSLLFQGRDAFLTLPEADTVPWRETYEALIGDTILADPETRDRVKDLGLADMNGDGMPELICYLAGAGKSDAAAIVTIEEGDARAFNADCTFGLPLAKWAVETTFWANAAPSGKDSWQASAFRYDPVLGMWLLNSGNAAWPGRVWCDWFRFGPDRNGYLTCEKLKSLAVLGEEGPGGTYRETGWELDGEAASMEDYLSEEESYLQWLRALDAVGSGPAVSVLDLRDKDAQLPERISAWLQEQS